MSWKYVPTYTRDLSNRESKYGLGSKLSSSPSDRWTSNYRNSIEPVEHRPVWAKTTTAKENPASVQRFKERSDGSDDQKREIRPYKKSETKDLSSPTSARPYGRSLTSTLNLGRLDRYTELDKRTEGSSLDNRKILYMPSATTKLLSRKYSSDLSPTKLNSVPKFSRDENENEIIVVTRGTSPTPAASSVYLRSKRTDYGLEKKVPRPRKRAEMANKETQTDREVSLKFSGCSDGGTRSRPYVTTSYAGSKLRAYGTETRIGFGSDCRRSISREDAETPTTPDSQKSLTSKPPTPTSPSKDSEKKNLGRKSPPANIRSSLKLDLAKTDLARNPNSPTRLSPLQCKIVNTETLQNTNKPQPPKVTVNCPDIDDVSSLSESSEEETSSDDEPEELAPMTVKKSVTNFLQNIPNHQNLSRANIFSKFGPQKINFKKIESGERAWWLESTDKVPDGIARMKSTRALASQEHDNHFLSPPYVVNRQFSRDKDWLKGSSEDLNKTIDNHSPKEDKPSWNGLTNGEAFPKPQVLGMHPAENESNHQMKFNQQPEDYLTDCSRECGIKSIQQKLQNGLGSPLEDKNLLEPADISGLISKAKAGLTKSKTKLDVKKSSSREMSPKVTDAKSEIDLYWKELADSLNRPLKLCDLDFTDLNSDDETDILGNSKVNGEVPPPPPMLILPVPVLTPTKNVPAPPTIGNPSVPRTRTPVPPPVPQLVKNKKTVKLFWKEVKDEPLLQGKIPDAALIWDELAKVKVDTQKLEYLFESRAKDLMSKKQQEQNKNKEIIVLDPKRSNAINIGMTKLPPPRAIKTAILKMDATVVNKEGIDKLLTMLPTEEEKVRIQEAQMANPDVPLGSAEQFLLTLASISELEARLRLWAFKLNFEYNEKEICEPLMDLKQGMEILRVNKTFRAILSTLLSVGNFLNGFDVKGFQIDYLSKVPEVKDTVHKHSLLHHLCIITMEKFPESTDLYSEIGAVTRASKVDFDELAANIRKIEEDCKLSWNYLKMIAKHEGHTAMKVKMSDFLADCAERIIVVGMVHKRIMNRFKKFALWLGVPMNRISTTRPNELFKVISEFALEYRTTRDRVLQQIKKINREKTRTRGYLNNDANDSGARKMNSKEAKDDARLKQLLENDTGYPENTYNASTWRRQRRDTKNLFHDVNNDDEEILDALIKTANQVSSPRLKERRRSRIYGKICEQKFKFFQLSDWPIALVNDKFFLSRRNLTRLHLGLKKNCWKNLFTL